MTDGESVTLGHPAEGEGLSDNISQGAIPLLEQSWEAILLVCVSQQKMFVA